mmetsp:Transcript_31642/g.46506  ORF Transcript_31642/g.46506 Transcript_31642/m.46506 type:complete len:167 (+) Transcript_31642:89-589(+)
MTLPKIIPQKVPFEGGKGTSEFCRIQDIYAGPDSFRRGKIQRKKRKPRQLSESIASNERCGPSLRKSRGTNPGVFSTLLEKVSNGAACEIQGDNESALRWYIKALEDDYETANTSLIAQAYHGAGRRLECFGRYEDAKKCFTHAKDIVNKQKNSEGEILQNDSASS